MAEALYRKYRPSTFEDVVGQEHIERTLKNAIEQDKVSHAYLFCGPRGTGKTTTARILAKALLCEQGPTVSPDGTCQQCELVAEGMHPDVYELDAASRTGVENVREEIISRVNYAPTQGAVKIYIIDEVHMLTTPAFNALLKTLEEPPAHVIFILCTTDAHKVPDTIQSRCQRFDFHRISPDTIVGRLGSICAKEGVDFEAEALDLIAYQAEGGMRNALTSLEQIIAFGEGHVTLEGTQALLGEVDDSGITEIVDAIGRRDAAACFTWTARYMETGADLARFANDLAHYIRNLYLMGISDAEVVISESESTKKVMEGQLPMFGQERLARLLGVLGDLMKDLRASSNPRLTFEIALTRMIHPESDLTLEALAERIEALETQGLPAVAVQPAPAAPAQQAAQMAVPAVAAVAEAPAPEPVPAPASEPAPAPAAEPAPAPQAEPAASAPKQVEAAAQPGVAASTADINNPAELQRIWRATTAALRQENPARGVVFMNTTVCADETRHGIVVEFASDNSFAYDIARKPEVLELLGGILAQNAGGALPVRLVLSNQPKAAAPSVTGSIPVVQAAAPSAQPAPAAPAAAAPAEEPAPVPAAAVAPAAAAPEPDLVPLDAYDMAPAQPAEQAPEPAPARAPEQPAAEPSAPAEDDGYTAVSHEPVPVTGPPEQPDPATPPSEADQIKDVLTASFGEGIKFEDA